MHIPVGVLLLVRLVVAPSELRPEVFRPVVSMVYYGVSMNTNFLGGNLYTTFVFGALMEVPAVLVVYFVVDRIGRKPLLAGGYIVAAICMLSNLAFTEERKCRRSSQIYSNCV